MCLCSSLCLYTHTYYKHIHTPQTHTYKYMHIKPCEFWKHLKEGLRAVFTNAEGCSQGEHVNMPLMALSEKG